MKTKVGVPTNDGQEVFLLSIIQRLEHAVVIDEARELVLNMGTQDRHVEGDAQQLAVGVPEVSARRITGFVQNLGLELQMPFFVG